MNPKQNIRRVAKNCKELNCTSLHWAASKTKVKLKKCAFWIFEFKYIGALFYIMSHLNTCCSAGFTDERLQPSVHTVKLGGNRKCQRSLSRSVSWWHFGWEWGLGGGALEGGGTKKEKELEGVDGRSTSLVVVFFIVSTRSKRSRQGPVTEEDGMLKMFHCPYEGCSQVYVAISSFQVNIWTHWEQVKMTTNNYNNNNNINNNNNNIFY